jgi:hypothetical protein
MEHIFQGKNLLSLILGVILLALGMIPLLNSWKVIPFGLPAFLVVLVSQIFIYLIAAGALWLLVDGFHEGTYTPQGKAAIGVGFVVFLIGIINILNKFKVIPFGIPFLTPVVYSVIFAIEGILLVYAAFTMI